MTAENAAPKATADRLLQSRQVVGDPLRNRKSARIEKPSEIGSYLALSGNCLVWRLVSCEDRRFTTPPTTNHLFWQRLPRTTVACYRFRNRTQTAHAVTAPSEPRGGGGVSSDSVAESFISISSHGIFYLIGFLCHSCCCSKKRASEPPRDSEPALSRELFANHR